MDIGVISVRYARALLKSATDAKIEDAVYTEMQQLAKSYVEVATRQELRRGAATAVYDRQSDALEGQEGSPAVDGSRPGAFQSDEGLRSTCVEGGS